MGPTANLLPDGQRLHLQHGPIDLIIGAEGERKKAFDAAVSCFQNVLDDLMGEIELLRRPVCHDSQAPTGHIARRMFAATQPLARYGYVTPMISVAGAVADTVLAAMKKQADLHRAYVNNGGDIALHLSKGTTYHTAIFGIDGTELGRLKISSDDPVRGIATSGRHGRSLSLGIADSVTVLATSAAMADGAATLIANAVDLPNHPFVSRRPACEINPDSDLSNLPVVTDCEALPHAEIAKALRAGRMRAADMHSRDLIVAAGLFLQGQAETTNSPLLQTRTQERRHA